eukprot:TRINITY_DN9489_c0_g1_i1.p1 TRINITY_DN9489_c0_g1~~TRINITY_DN9489_c0_g1_i1.p1  ORF type:complete len:101 (-),score=13.56 TRINITY_DN9489_c0_g1_i1:163-465(-)
MKLVTLICLVAAAIAEPEAEAEPQFYGGYRGYGVGHLGYTGLGYGHHGFGYRGFYGKREAEAEAKPQFYRGYMGYGVGLSWCRLMATMVLDIRGTFMGSP